MAKRAYYKTKQIKKRKPKSVFRKTISLVLAFLIIFQTIAGIFLPVNFQTTPPYISHTKEARASGESWYNSSWSYRKQITIDHTKVADVATPSATYANFPVLISLDALSNINANGTDIRFTFSDGVTELPREIEKYSSGSLRAWVKTTLTKDSSDSTDDIIYMYYGNAGATEPAASSAYGSQNVWKTDGVDTSAAMVQHLKEDPSGSAPQMIDSTANANNGTSGGTMTTSDQIAGQIDGSLDFDGSNDYVNAGNGASLKIEGRNPITLEAWIYRNGNSVSSYPRPVYKERYVSETDNGGYMLSFGSSTGLSMNFALKNNSNGIAVNTTITNGQWYHIVGTYDGNNMYIYNNGVASSPVSNTAGIGTLGTVGTSIGSAGGFFKGSIDEVRIYNRALSAQEITTQYNNTNSPSTFYSLGIEEKQSPTALTSWGYRKAITIDHTKVSSAQTNFPVLINLPTDAGLASHALSTGNDILFTSSSTTWGAGTENDKLAHEIEKYTTATGELQAWVRVPSLSSTVDTVIYIYYGNATATSQQNKTVVWDGSAKMVQHLKEDPSGSAPQMIDSTYNANNATSSGTMTTSDQVAGQIDGSLDFDGTDDYVNAGSGASLDMTTNDFSVSFWAKGTQWGIDKYLLSKFKWTTTNLGWAFLNDAGGLWGSIGNGTASTTIGWGSFYPSVNVWYFISLTRTGNLFSYSVNGVQKGTTTQSYNLSTTANLNIGRYSDYGVSRQFNGSIDEVRIYNRALSAQEITTQYNNTNSPSTFYSLGAEEVYEVAVTADSITPTAGAAQTLTITIKDASGATLTTYTGDKSVILSGANLSPNSTAPTCTDKNSAVIPLGTATTLTFTSGVATCSMILYKAETATITTDINDVADTNLAVTVSSAALNNFLVEAPASADSGAAFSTTITSRDLYHNTTLTVTGDTTLSVNQSGSITPAIIADTNFTDDGIYIDNLTITSITENPSVTITATNGSATGADAISILGIPANPSSASASRVSDTEFTFTWSDNSTIETGYRIERETDGAAWAEIGTTAASPYSDTTTSSDHKYRYRVRAYNSIGNSGDYATDATEHFTSPDIPSNIIGAYSAAPQFSISWTDNAAVENTHRIQHCSNANCDTATYETDLGTFESSPQIDSSSIAANSRYRWQARSETPDSLNSNYASSNYEYTAPPAPTIQDAVFVSATQVTVNWLDTSDYEDGFRIAVSVDGGAYSEITPAANTAGANIQSYSYTSLPDHYYKFKVQSHIAATSANAEFLSDYSAESIIIYTTSAAPAIGAPIIDSSTAITWNWTDNSAIEEFYRLDFITGSGLDVDNISADSASYQTAGLAPNTQYAVHLHSYRADTGESPASADSAAKYTLANIPSNLSLASISQTQINASWTANSNPASTEYYIENTAAGSNSGWITAASWASANLACGTNYSFRAKAKNGDGTETAFTDSISKSTDSCGSGLPPTAYNPPAPPPSSPANPEADFNISINNNAAQTNAPDVILKLAAGSDAKRMAISNTADFAGAIQEPYQSSKFWILSAGDGVKTVYVKFYTSYGVSSKTVSDSIILNSSAPEIIPAREPSPEIPENISQSIPEKTNDQKIPSAPKPAPSSPADPYSTAAADKPETGAEPTLYFQTPENKSEPVNPGWNLMPSPEIKNFFPQPGEISFFTEKFPPLSEAFSKLNIFSIKDISSRASEASFNIPDLSEIIGLQSENIYAHQTQPLSPIPLASLSQTQKEKIPAEIVFVSTANEKINLSSSLVLDEESLKQKISAPASTNLNIAIKSDQPAKSISGYLALKKNTYTLNDKLQMTNDKSMSNNEMTNNQNNLNIGNLIEIRNLKLEILSLLGFKSAVAEEIKPTDKPQTTETRFVLAQFQYADSDQDGIWTADIQTPAAAGEYEIISLINYQDPNIPSKEIRLIAVIDPEGYVHERIANQELRIMNAEVSIYWLNPASNEYELWSAKDYGQKNPQTTDATGRYFFLVPAGSYYLKAEAPSYYSYQSDIFIASETENVRLNLEMKPIDIWKSISQKTLIYAVAALSIVIFILIVFLAYNFYEDRRRIV